MSFPVNVLYGKIPVVEEVSESTEKLARLFLTRLPGRMHYPKDIDERTFVELLNVFSAPGDRFVERFSKHVAFLALNALSENDITYVLSKEGIYVDPERPEMDLHTYMLIPHPFSELKLYHLPVSGGNVLLVGRLRHVAAALIYRKLLELLPIKTKVPLSKFTSLMPQSKRAGGRGSSFFKRLEQASGIPDGRKRILYFWLIPYWVNIAGLSVDEAVERAKEWSERQGAQIYESWMRSEARNAKQKGIRPWSLKKVQTVSPDLIKILQEVGILD